MAKKSSESNTGLIIALVLFVLATITLGVTTYFGYADQAAKEAGKKKAEDDTRVMTKLRDAELAAASTLRLAMGISAKTDAENLTSLRKEHDGVISEQISKYNQAFGALGATWNPAQSPDAPSLNVKALVTRLVEARETAETKAQQNFDAKGEADKKHATDAQTAESRVKTLEGELVKAKAELNKEKGEKAAAFAAIEGQNTKLGDDLAKRTREGDELIAKANRENKTGQQTINELRLKNDKITQDAAKAGGDLLAFDQPKGKIISIDRATNLVYINLGSSDFLRPQLTFSVLPAEAVGKGALDPKAIKGKLEVIQIQGAHLATAKITEQQSLRNPLLADDLLFNPSWSPSLRERVAVAGFIDLNGDGEDDTIDFVRNLQRMGVIVDMYLDLKEMAEKGKGISYQTSYLVLGDRPQVATENIAGDRLSERKRMVRERVSDIENRAKGMGIQVVAARKFLAMIGYPTPKVAADANYTNLVRGDVSSAPAGDAPPKAEKPKAEPKKNSDKKEKTDE